MSDVPAKSEVDEFSDPCRWRSKSLGEVCARVTTRNAVGETNVLTISAEHGLIRQSEYFNRVVASQDLSTYFLLARGDFAYNKSYSAGYPAGVIRRLDRYPSGVVSPLYICFRPASRDLDSDFLRHYFAAGRLDDSLGFLAKEGARNHGLLNVGIDDFMGLPIDVPPLAEQRRIAEILDTVDDAIRATERLIAKLEVVRRGMLGDLMARYDRGPKALRDCLDAVFPGAWGDPPIGRGTDVRVLRSTEVGDDGSLALDTAVERNLSSREQSRCVLESGDILLEASGGAPRRPVGRSALFADPRDGRVYAASNFLRVVRPSATVSSRFIAWYMLWLYQLPRIRQFEQRTTGIANLRVHEYLAQPLGLPDVEEQERVSSILDASQAAIDAGREELDRLRLIKLGLMEDLLIGRVRVPAEAITA